MKLPTAARHRIDNKRFADQRRACIAIRAVQPWPGKYIPPFAREARRKADALANLGRSPELFALLAIMTAFPADRLAALGATAELLLLRDGDGEAAKLGHLLVMEALALRRAAETIARPEVR